MPLALLFAAAARADDPHVVHAPTRTSTASRRGSSRRSLHHRRLRAAVRATPHILRWLLNSLIVSVVAIVSHLVLCSLAGYGFARLRFRGPRRRLLRRSLATIMIPTQLLMIPTYIMFARLGLIDTLGAAFVPWLATAFGIFLMRQFFLSLPRELEEAGRLDGCTPLRRVLRHRAAAGPAGAGDAGRSSPCSARGTT